MLGSFAGRLTSLVVGQLVLFGSMFYLVPVLFETADANTAMLATLGVMLVLIIGVAIGVAGWPHRSAKFWQYITAVSVTTIVLTASQSITFGSLGESSVTLSSIWAYGTHPFSVVVLSLTAIGLVMSYRQSHTNEFFIEPLMSVVGILPCATMLFAHAGLYSIFILLFAGIVVASATQGEMESSLELPAGVSSLREEVPAFLKRQED